MQKDNTSSVPVEILPSERERSEALAIFGRCSNIEAFLVLKKNGYNYIKAEKELLINLIGLNNYEKLHDEFNDIITQYTGPERVFKIIEVQHINSETLDSLIFAWCAQMKWIGEISEEEVIRGVYFYKKYLNGEEVIDTFSSEFFTFVFDVSTKYISKNLSTSEACVLLNMLVKEWPLLDAFSQCIQKTRDEVSRDEWVCLHRFMNQFRDEISLKTYTKHSSSYPLLMDEFVKGFLSW